MNETRTADLFGDAAAPATLPLHQRHPRASREIRLGEHQIGYELRRARRRTIGFVVAAEGLTVSAPRWVSVADIEAGVREKSAWILRKLVQMREQARRQHAARVEWRDGTSLRYLGQPLTFRLDATIRGTRLEAETATLRLALPASASVEQMRGAAMAWLKREARRTFEARMAHFAPRLRVVAKALALSSAATRWGSASSSGTIRLNWRLIHLGLPLIDYVVVHELAHLRHMDHSARFWEVVGAELPGYQEQRAALKSEAVPTL